ncbi:DUF4097 family beta strand repeat-containing protein [Streptomyces sp. NPDC018031]|uniref:DUF4097 family beta strand repeat-containing protein n=1 Tax=Streptomyces sp. NPDC018031 TaxID=3365033 RepID=UPI0037B4866E
MSDRSEWRSAWRLAEPRKLTFDGSVSALRVRLAGGTVNVVGSDRGPARLELTALDGPPLVVGHHDGTLTVSHDDPSATGLAAWLDPSRRHRAAHVTLTVPATAGVSIHVIGADSVVSGIGGGCELRGVSGDCTLVGLTGPVRAGTVSGRVEAQAVTGTLHFHSLSGDLTVVEGGGPVIRADSVGGTITLDLAPAARGADLAVTTVSGGIAVRLPHPADAEVRADTTSGAVSCDFDDLRVRGEWGAKKVTGTLGAGSGSLRATTVSGAIALLRRPPSEDDRTDLDSEGKVL